MQLDPLGRRCGRNRRIDNLMTSLRILVFAATLAGAGSTVMAQTIVSVHADDRHQTIRGFGCSINAWTAPFYGLYYDDAFTEYVVEELGMSVFRLQMWGGVSPDPVADWRDISYEDFKWTGEGIRGKLNVDWARRLVDANPEVKVIGTVWSPPAWMKENESRIGTRSGYLFSKTRDYDDDNRLRDDRYRHFAKWVVEWARYMESQGTPFYAISLQNELVFTQWFESTLYTPEEYARVVRVTGEMFEAEGVRKPLFFGPEDMTGATYHDEIRHKPFVDALMAPEVARYFDVFATHGYSDGVASDSENDSIAYWESIAHLGYPYWITEGGTGGHIWPEPVTTGIAPRLHTALALSNVSLFTGWQLTGSPEEGGTEHDFMVWDEPTPKTYATMHFWRHIRPGAVRVGTELSGPGKELLVSAYRHDGDSQAVTVLINQGTDAREVAVDWGADLTINNWKAFQTSARQSHEPLRTLCIEDGVIELTLPPLSITTLLGDYISKRKE